MFSIKNQIEIMDCIYNDNHWFFFSDLKTNFLQGKLECQNGNT